MQNDLHRLRRTALAAVVLLVLVPGLVGASVAKRLSLQDLTSSSTSIVVGTCRLAQARWSSDRRVIETVAVYDVGEVLKGSPYRTITVTSLGGVVDGIGMYVAGMPTFVPGRQEILFLTGTDENSQRVVGMGQGQFVIGPSTTGIRTVHQLSIGVDLVGPSDPNLRPRSVSRFIDSVRRIH